MLYAASNAPSHPLLLEARKFEPAIEAIFAESWPEERVEDFLCDLAGKGESEAEILGCVQVMLSRIPLIDPTPFETHNDVLDIGGTGGSKKGLFNISTTAVLIVAAAGIPVLKHGNRGFSSPTGSADMIEALGIKLSTKRDPDFVNMCLEQAGMAYLYTPVWHKFPPGLNDLRRKLGIRTLFNLAGPIAHPARLKRQMIGVSDDGLLLKFAKTLSAIGREHALLYFGAGGIDEISLAGETIVTELEKGDVTTRLVAPEDFGIARQPLSAIKGGDAALNADICRSVLAGEESAYADATLLSAAAAFLLSDVVSNLQEGVRLARDVIGSGLAEKQLKALVEVSHDYRH
ncbi:MAG: anthranilate phosphoribosyltransferase [Sneathiella sp.]